MSNDRGVSTTISYVLTFAIAGILVTGLLIAGGEFVDDRREQVIRTELRVIGQQVASDLGRADRLVQAANDSDPSTVRLNQTFPRRVSGSSYQITIATENPDTLVLESVDPALRVTVNFSVRTAIETDSTSDGGVIQVHYDTSGDQLVIGDV